VLTQVLYTPVHSLIDQSLHSRLGAETTNGDGFGVGWYDAAPARVGGLEEGEDDFVPGELEFQVQSRRASRWLTRRAVSLDDLLTAIGLLGAEIPAAHRLRLVNLPDHDGPAIATDHEPTPNLRARLKNALQKMCSAATDVRLFERDPTTNAHNIVRLIEALWLPDQVPILRSRRAGDWRQSGAGPLIGGCFLVKTWRWHYLSSIRIAW
jgi:hypothetical protein